MEETSIAKNTTTKTPSSAVFPASEASASAVGTDRTIVDVDRVDFHYRTSKALHGVNLQIPEKKVTAFIGPSGCGKSTLLRCFNRMNDLIDHAKVTAGEIAQHAFSLLRDCLTQMFPDAGHASAKSAVELDALFVWSTMHGRASILQTSAIRTLALPSAVLAATASNTLQRIGVALSLEGDLSLQTRKPYEEFGRPSRPRRKT
jgi:ABC-type phosphate/phosphonate transport system ATPase subunit